MSRTLGALIALVIILSTVAVVGAASSEVLVRAQYSASIGGKNEPIEGVAVGYTAIGTLSEKVATTNQYGQCYAELTSGTTYAFSVTYKEKTKKFSVQYKGESVLLIHVDPIKGEVVGMEFQTPKTVTGGKDGYTITYVTIAGVLGAAVAVTAFLLLRRRR
jgi:hypothetical protein